MISAIILTKNEEANIKRCLKNLTWCNEIIIIDDYSIDNTIKISKQFKCKIFKRHLGDNFSAQRNFGLSKAKYDWILFIDADEVVTKKLQKEIFNSQFSNNSAFYLKRHDLFMGKKINHGETNIKLLRLAKKNSGKWKRKVHEYWNIKSEKGILNTPLEHYPHASVKEFLNEINSYSVIHANENKKERKKSSIINICFFPLGKFIYNYILKLGFCDGVEGLIIAVMMSFHSFISWSIQWMD